MKTSKLSIEELLNLIQQGVAQSQWEHDGYIWAAMPQEDWAKHFGVDARTFRRWIAKEPSIQSDTTMDTDGRKVYLLRVGEAGPMTPRKIANKMTSYFDKAVRKHSPKEFGMAMELAKTLPDGEQLSVFKNAIQAWPKFMAYVKLHMADLEIHEGMKLKPMFLQYPSIATILKFRAVAIDLYVDHLQEMSIPPSPAIVALNPSIWPKHILKHGLIMSETPAKCPDHLYP